MVRAKAVLGLGLMLDWGFVLDWGFSRVRIQVRGYSMHQFEAKDSGTDCKCCCCIKWPVVLLES